MATGEDRDPLLIPMENGKVVLSNSPTSGGDPSQTKLWTEAKKVLGLAVPISLSEVVSYAAYLITTAQVGRLGSLELSAVTLARSFFHVTGLSLVVGMASAVPTFCGQAHGAGHPRVLGVVLQRATLLCLLTCALPLALWARADWLMTRMGQQPEVVPLAARYVRLLGPALCLWGVGGCIKSYLASQGVVTPLTVVAVAYTALTPLVNHLFMFSWGLGMFGAAVAYNVLQVLEVLFLLAAMAWLHFCRQQPGSRTWQGFSGQALRGWGGYLKIALPSAAAICLDWWTYEAVVLIAGVLPDASVELGAMGLAFNTHALLFMVVEGFSSAASTRVSNELGAGSGRGARRAALTSLVLGVAAPLAASAGLLAAPRAWARIYTPDRAIISLVVRLMPVLTLSNLADSVASVTSGVLRGSGRQELAFKVNLAAYWLLGLPCAALLALRYQMGALGLWLAMGGASALQASILVGNILHFDWPEEARKALHRVAVAEGAHGAEQTAALGAGGGGGGNGDPLSTEADEEAAEPTPQVVLHGGLESRHGVYEPLLTAQHVA